MHWVHLHCKVTEPPSSKSIPNFMPSVLPSYYLCQIAGSQRVNFHWSEPHTIRTALQDCMVAYNRPCGHKIGYEGTNTFQICTRAKAWAQRRREKSLEWRQLKLMHTSAWELQTMICRTDKGRLLTDGTVTVVQVRAMHNDTHKCQRFSSWLHCEV